LLISSGDMDGIAIPGIFIAPHMFRTNSKGSVMGLAPEKPGIPDVADIIISPKSNMHRVAQGNLHDVLNTARVADRTQLANAG
jgi:hypothetical protein